MGHKQRTINDTLGEEIQQTMDLLSKLGIIEIVRTTRTSITITTREGSRDRLIRDYRPKYVNRSIERKGRKRRK